MKYYIYQAMLTAGGTGDFCKMEECETLEEAREAFERLKKDIKGYDKKPHGYLRTELFEECSPEVFEKENGWIPDEDEECSIIIDGYDYYYWKHEEDDE